MTHAVVDVLEVIEVDEQHRQFFAIPPGPGNGTFQMVLEEEPVRQLRKRVVVRLEVQLLILRRGGVGNPDAVRKITDSRLLVFGKRVRADGTDSDGADVLALPDDRHREHCRGALLQQQGRERRRGNICRQPGAFRRNPGSRPAVPP
ncbi:MAG: hypothetical protein ABIO63_06365, partial [Casimicrobiaceae bacterium]